MSVGPGTRNTGDIELGDDTPSYAVMAAPSLEVSNLRFNGVPGRFEVPNLRFSGVAFEVRTSRCGQQADLRVWRGVGRER